MGGANISGGSAYFAPLGGIIEIGSGMTWNPASVRNRHSGLVVLSGGTLLATSLAQTITGTVISAGGSEVVQAGVVVTGTVINGGSETVSGTASGTTVNSGGQQTVYGTASNTVISGGHLYLAAGGVLGGSVSFAGAGGKLSLEATTLPTNTISGFVAGDSIDLTGVAFDTGGSVDLIGHQLRITENGQTYHLNLDPNQDFTGHVFQAHADSANPGAGTMIIEDGTACYCRGTMILTPEGEVPVEELAIGDLLITASHEAKPIRWIGHRSYDGRFVAGNRNVLPICVASGAIADGLPVRDLWVSPEHALYIEDVLVPAKELINGTTVTQLDTVEEFHYFHIELDQHDVIFADGAPAETFVDCDNRPMFANAAEYARLYREDERPRWEFCAPRVDRGSPALAAIRAQMRERAHWLGHCRGEEIGPHLIIDGVIHHPILAVANSYRFDLPGDRGKVRLVSPSFVPIEREAGSRDRRRLGLAIERIVLYDGTLSIEAGHGHQALQEGFHAAEASHRWTDGDARIPDAMLRLFPGSLTIEINLV
jgi:autotransporter passenger strand-loop-strand repeat protein